jgi:hypothetical protein
MSMLENLALMGIRAEAMRIAERAGVSDTDSLQRIEAALRVEAYKRTVQPYHDMKLRILTMRVPSRVVLADGEVKADWEPLSPEAQRCIDSLDELIDAEAKRWGFPLPTT